MINGTYDMYDEQWVKNKIEPELILIQKRVVVVIMKVSTRMVVL